MREEARFIYFHKAAGEAIAYTERVSYGGDLLFTCPLSWLPKNQKEFEQAAKFYGISHPEVMKYYPDEVPF